jgi:hypothetical protein
MDPDDFRELIEDSVGDDADPALWDALTDPSVISRTKKCLGGIHQDLLAQVTLRNADLDEYRAECLTRGEEGKRDFYARKGEEADWRRRLAGYRRLVQYRIALVNSRIDRRPQMPSGSKTARMHNFEALENLACAVAGHERKVTSGTGDERDDEALWDCLTTITAIAGNREMPLAEWLEYLEDARESSEGSVR